MSSKTRLANKTIWALEDIIALGLQSRRSLDVAIGLAEKHRDPALLAALARLSQQVAEVDGLARDAREGKYRRGVAVEER